MAGFPKQTGTGTPPQQRNEDFGQQDAPAVEREHLRMQTAGNERLTGKVAIITGGSWGIGAATVRLFSKHGAKVIIMDNEGEKGKKFANSLSPPASHIKCDLSNEDQVHKAVNSVIAKYNQLDIMFNNAEIIERFTMSIEQCDMGAFHRMMNKNMNEVMHGLKYAAREMKSKGEGCIISTAGITRHNYLAAYAASKHAVIGLTKDGAAELAKYSIRVNCVSSYGFGTTVSDDDIAEAVLYLASKEAKHVSGHNIEVNGL
uniref:Uncharacterized protein n=1 Tax=Araucaria cunninghamii TaxID=56994 RepID=A0A0D6QXH4_ARACU